MKRMNKKQVAEILGVHYKSLLRWDNEKIKYELLKVCYKVVDIVKEGRSTYFYMMYEEYSQSNDEHLQEVFNVKDIKGLKEYTKRKTQSIESSKFTTRNELCMEADISVTTSKRYDKKLIEKGVFEKLDEVLYICVDKETKEKVLVDKKAYNNFWIKNDATGKELNSLKRRVDNKEISIDEYNYLRDMIISGSKSLYVYYRVSKIIIKYDNYLYKMLVEEEENPLFFYW